MSELSRRSFLGGTLVGIAATTPASAFAPEGEPKPAETPPPPQPAPAPEPTAPATAPRAMSSVAVRFELNGTERAVEVHPDDSALHVLRKGCGLTGSKE